MKSEIQQGFPNSGQIIEIPKSHNRAAITFRSLAAAGAVAGSLAPMTASIAAERMTDSAYQQQIDTPIIAPVFTAGEYSFQPTIQQQPEVLTEQDKDQEVSDFLNDWKMRAVVLAGAVYGASSIVETRNDIHIYNRGSKGYQLLRQAAPVPLVLTAAALGIDSVTEINREIAPALFLTYTALQSASHVWETFRNHRNPKSRAYAVATATLLNSFAITLLNALR